MYFKYVTVFATALFVTMALTPLVRQLALRWGVVDLPGKRRVNTNPIPRLGGIAVFWGVQAAAAVIFIPAWRQFAGNLDFAWWMRFLIASAFITGVGVADDIYGLRPRVKLAGQIAAALLAYIFKMRFGIALNIPLPWVIDLCATVCWILAFTNAFNLIDGMDGLATGLALIAAIGMTGGLILRHLPADALVLLGLTGACAGFLRYNFYPASVFLGDSGSMFLGFTLAVVSLSSSSKGAAMATIGVPLLAAGVPLLDAMLAVWRRFVRGLLPAYSKAHFVDIMHADMEHLHHRLSRSGASQRYVTLTLYVLGCLLVGVALLALAYRAHAAGIYLIAFVAGSYVIVRHLARVELWESGAAMLYGLRRQPSKVIAVIVYPVLDVIILAGCLAIAMWLTGLRDNFKYVWLQALPVWVGISFLALFAVRAYQRVWSRARLSEFLLLDAALLLALLLSIALAVMRGIAFDLQLLLQALLYYGMGTSLITGMRMLSRALQDMVALTARHPSLLNQQPTRNVFLYGAGTRGILFLRYWSARYPGIVERRRVVGFLDDDSNLHGRWVYGYLVRGGVRHLAKLARQHSLKEVIVTANLTRDALLALKETAKQHNLILTEWKAGETRWED